jgi:hypothetical protein
MTPTEMITLVIALAALIASAVSATETLRQRRNAVRPVVVVLEKLTDNDKPDAGYSLFLCNMGQAVAINIRVVKSNVRDVLAAVPPVELVEHRTEVACGRRSLLARGYREPVIEAVSLVATYTDVNDTTYVTRFGGRGHAFKWA